MGYSVRRYMKTKTKQIIFIGIVLLIILTTYLILSSKEAKMKNDTDEIKRFNNCIVFDRIPVRYITDDMIIERCVPLELLMEINN